MSYALIGILVVVLDQAVKYWAARALPLASTGKVFIPGILSLVNLHNDGAAFGFLAGSNARIPFIIITGVFIVAVILALATRFVSGKFARWCLVLVTAGGLSNCIDRVIYGYVQDMFKCELFNFPIFNVADIFISVFAILFVLAVLFERKTVYDDFADEDLFDEDDDYDDDDDEAYRAERRAEKARKRQSRRAGRAERDYDDDIDIAAARVARQTRRERPAEAPAPARTAAPAAPRPSRPAPASDPFAEWERANARAAAQPTVRPAAPSVQPRPAAPQQPTAAPAAQPVRPTARPAAPAKKPAAQDDFSLDDILAEFK